MKKDLVSIIMPMYNAEKYIEESIQSVRKQTFKNWELIIIDDCSTDRSKLIVKEYMKLDERIFLLSQLENRGPAEARNYGMSRAKGEFIAFLDSDDIWIENKLERQIYIMNSNNSSLSCTSYILMSEYGKELSRFRVKDEIKYQDLLKKNMFSCNTVILRKSNFNDLRMQTIDQQEDYLFWLKLIKYSGKAIGIDECLAKYRIVKGSRSSGYLKNAINIFKVYYLNEGLNIINSFYYTMSYCINGLIKYRNIKR